MAKNKKQTIPTETIKQRGKPGQHLSKKSKRDGKPKQEEHLEQIPFRLREIMKSKELMKKGPAKTKKMKEVAVNPRATKGSEVEDIPVPHFKRGKRESEQAYVRRMNNETAHVLFLTKNQVERQPEKEVEDQEKPAHGKSDKKKDYDKTRLQRLQKKKLDRQEERAEKEMLVDKVEFGDVAMAPPTLSVKPKKAPIKGQGVNSGLLLTSLLGQSSVLSSGSKVKPSMSRQRIVEEERLRVVEAYRHLKKQKLQQQQNQKAGLDKLINLQ